MPPEPDDNAAHLSDMLHYAREVAARVAHASFNDFLANDDFRLATERRIEIIGEAARWVSDDFKTAHPEIPWRPSVTSSPTSTAK